MLSVRKSVLFAVLTAVVSQGALAANTNALRGTLLKPQAAARFTPADTERMEAARALILNGTQDKVEWVGDAAFKGEFKIEGRYTVKDTQTAAASYIHILRDKTTNQTITEDLILEDGKTKRTVDLAIRGFVKLENGQWSRYTGDKQLLIPVTAASAAPAASTPRAEPTASQPVAAPRASAVDQIPPTGPVGPDYSAGYQNILGRTKLGEMVHSFKVLAVQLKETLDDPKYANASGPFKETTAKNWAKARAQAWVAPMAQNTAYIAIDQLALVIKEVENEAAKVEVLTVFSEGGRIDARLGDKSTITTQFQNSRLRSQASRMLINRD